jgi:hypothetical protein
LGADVLETAIIDLIMRTYQEVELFERAIKDALACASNGVDRLDAELKIVAVDIRKVTDAIDRYFHAFETEALTGDALSGRLRSLQGRLDELTVHRADLEGDRRVLSASPASSTTLRALRDSAHETLFAAEPKQVKRLLAVLVERISIGADRTVTPELRIPMEIPDAPPSAAPTGGPMVRLTEDQVEVMVPDSMTSATSVSRHRRHRVEGCSYGHGRLSRRGAPPGGPLG